MIRLAAIGDIHAGEDSIGTLRPGLEDIADRADALLLAGDLTRTGRVEEARALAGELDALAVPVVGVLGNHDHHSDQPEQVRKELEAAGVIVLEREAHTLEIGGATLGIVGAKGFGGGFAGASATEFGELEMKAFVRTTQDIAEDVERLLRELQTDVRVLLLHYSPVRDTLRGEPPEIFPFLGSYLLAEAADRAGADLILHGHAHRGCERGRTVGGITVRNVALPVVGHAYSVYTFDRTHPASPFAW
jgi:Icc-related predicted phosphoesterase